MNRRNALRNTLVLAGSAIATPTLLSLLQSCNKQSRLDWKPLFLNEEQARFVSAFVDTLLPKTDTPGALDVKTDIFLDAVFAKTYDGKAQEKVKNDIDQFNAAIKAEFGKVFTDLKEEDKIKALQKAEMSSPKFNGKVWGTTVGEQPPVGFYRSLKSMALWAYFSSEEIGKNHLNYDPIPGEYRGCVPLEEIGNSWSL
ncbi:gluconate 2-dehydrogenase subunit 3 family protein [Pararhodonellum marinum]|uniref:gluconate 2-dehydrogenase subunit 3 family protein n=1 Tax=Pararhodonellum marinum TaxID=2755358 RepID=UPI001890894E|nr:gluconate 2-dehydrogenase subunit 3 family protein [Pararhodonellum marinum]